MNDTFMDDDSDYLMPSDSNDVPDTLTNFVDYIGAAHHQQQMYSPHIKNGTDDDSNKLIRLVLYSLVSYYLLYVFGFFLQFQF